MPNIERTIFGSLVAISSALTIRTRTVCLEVLRGLLSGDFSGILMAVFQRQQLGHTMR